MRRLLFNGLVFAASLIASAKVLAAQGMHDMMDDSTASPVEFMAGASAILLGTVASPGVNDRTLAEGYITQPLLMGMARTRGGGLTGNLTLDLEGMTLERGELNAGVYGEGFIDRRHPHTVLHEVTATGLIDTRVARLSLTAGKGFVPFGTDDPMSRPFVKYPVNHHLAQILERAMIVGAASTGQFAIEGAMFNGDEPQSTGDMPNWDRFGDSWAVRLTARPTTPFEIQGSFAKVKSPEQPQGGGLDQKKLSVSGRYEARRKYALVEWARTQETERGTTAFTFNSILAEGSMSFGRLIGSARAERTERPEEERLLNPFRTPRPHSDLAIVGRTRWTVLTASASYSMTEYGTFSFNPFVEVSSQNPRSIVNPSAFDPASFYGASRLWSFSFGARMGIGMKHERMGRYGAAMMVAGAGAMHDMEGM